MVPGDKELVGREPLYATSEDIVQSRKLRAYIP
jgi:hypothetical protein